MLDLASFISLAIAAAALTIMAALVTAHANIDAQPKEAAA